MTINSHIIFAGVVIGGAGLVNGWVNGTPVTPVIIGSYVFLLMLALLDSIGGPVSDLAGALAMIAVLVVLLDEFPWQAILGAIGFKQG